MFEFHIFATSPYGRVAHCKAFNKRDALEKAYDFLMLGFSNIEIITSEDLESRKAILGNSRDYRSGKTHYIVCNGKKCNAGFYAALVKTKIVIDKEWI